MQGTMSPEMLGLIFMGKFKLSMIAWSCEVWICLNKEKYFSGSVVAFNMFFFIRSCQKLN